MAPASGSMLARRQLGSRLRELRQAAGKTLPDVELTGIGSVSKLYRIESGRSAVRTGDVRDLCALYGADEQTLDGLLALARASRAGGWQEEYQDVLFPGFRLYLDLEAGATALSTYDPELVHGLLQIPDYLRSIVRSDVTDDQMRRFLEVRRERGRATLERESPMRLTAIMGEAALARVIGSPQVMAAQLNHLREMTRLDHVQIRILAFDSGWHPALTSGAFTILDFEDAADPDIVYLESLTTARYLEGETQLHEYRRLWNILAEQSIPLEEYSR